MFENESDIERVFYALSEHLALLDAGTVEIVVCGGAAMNILGYVRRTTEDVDVIAFIDTAQDGKKHLIKATPMRSELIQAAQEVARDFNLKENWFNSAAASVMDFGLPEGLLERTESRSYGKNLIVHFLTRFDQIHFKLYAAVDRGGKHVDDLLALKPNSEELQKAAQWSMTHDVSEGYREVLKSFLTQIGFSDVADKL
jgi:hypothetical protein